MEVGEGAGLSPSVPGTGICPQDSGVRGLPPATCIPLCTPNRSSKPMLKTKNYIWYVDKCGFVSVPHPPPPKTAAPMSPASLGSGDRHGCTLQLLTSFLQELGDHDGIGAYRDNTGTSPGHGGQQWPRPPHRGLQSQPLAGPPGDKKLSQKAKSTLDHTSNLCSGSPHLQPPSARNLR